ncbi:hypothetical protein [Mycobacterium vicinigordonae]|uniref:Uncharacterized protein n=1 Tax=Mycobacterium vicinigordonae TaxID=1719132 RepID=A0A7D6E5L4_9MYCO|nr:hypothetical protein [Mycobacterium vicinigordonae]QLL07902.1 hypothetical protein H0P51_02590 [Mycobacterium vicinigordonae]
MRPEDAAGRVDALVASIAPKLAAPVVNRREVVLVAGPWLAGVTAVATALRQRLPQHNFVESTELEPGAAPKAVVFVVSAAAPLTDSDCSLLDAAAENTDVVVAVVAKIDVHYAWRDVLADDEAKLARHAPRYARVPWVGAAAAPEVGPPQVDDLIAAVQGQLADSDTARRNRLRAWESRLQKAAQRFDRDADGAGRRARVDSLREERSAALRQRRQSRSERSIMLRGQIQQARVQLSYFARNRCSSVRTELQEDIAGLPRRAMAGFEAEVRRRLEGVAGEVAAGVDSDLVEVARHVGVPLELPAAERPTVSLPAAQLKSRRLETRLLMVFGVAFGLGVALTLSRVVAGLAPRLHPGLMAAGIAGCAALGLAMAAWVVHIRTLLGDRAALDRWVGEATSSLRSVLEQTVASRVVVAESLLSTEVTAHDEVENARVNDKVSRIDGELREHALAAARAAAARDREMPTIQAALDAVRAELGDPSSAPIAPHSDAGSNSF